MKNKVKMNEGLESLERILLMMKYDNKKTLSENYDVLKEQPDTKFDTPYNKEFMRQHEPQSTFLKQCITNPNSHECLGKLSLSLTALGFATSFFPPASGIFFGLGTAVDLYDAKKYLDEGDEYSAGLYAALSIIPGGEFVSATGKTAKQLSKTYKLLKSGAKLSDDAVESMNKLGKFLQRSDLNKLIIKGLKSKFIIGMNNLFIKNPLQFFNILYTLYSKVPGLAKIAINIGGTYYTFDQIYLAWYHNNQERLDDRTLNPLKKLVDWMSFKENEKEVVDAISRKYVDETINNFENIQKRDIKVVEKPYDQMKNDFLKK